MRLILVRHAQTRGNKHAYVGRADLPLDETGRVQAERLAVDLGKEPVSAIYSSPLRRALETAAPLAGRFEIDVAVRPALVEIDFGAIEGMAKDTRPLSLKRAHRHTPLPGGESLWDVWQRLAPLAAELRETLRHGAAPVVIGHYWSNRLLRDLLHGLSFDEALSDGSYKPANASAVVIEVRA